MKGRAVLNTAQSEATTKPDFRVVNKRLPRNDAYEKLLGTTRYAADFTLEGMLHAGLVRSPMPSARIVTRDASEAEQLAGVVAVYFAEDIPSNELPTAAPSPDQPLPSTPVLAKDRVYYHGQPIALVVAESREVLRNALGLVDIEYDELPCVSDPAVALQPGAPLVHESGNLVATWDIDRGDVAEAMQSAHVVVEHEYRAQVVDHAYLEPEAGVGWLDDEGVINIRAATQVVERYRDVAKILGIPDGKVRIQVPYIGGGFGGKEDLTVEPFIGLAVQRLRRPVSMVWTRQESLTARPKRHPVWMRYRTAADKKGRLVAQDIEILSDAGAYPMLSAAVLLCLTASATGPYRCANVRVHSRSAYTNNVPSSAFRGFGGMQTVLGYEGQIDAVAAALGFDRIEVRKLNMLTAGEKIPIGQPIDDVVWLSECLDRVLDALGEPPEPSSPTARVGRGIACNLATYGRPLWMHDNSSAWVGFELDGSVVVRCGVPDVGAGQVSSLAQITAEVLSVGLDQVTVHFGDSARTPLAGRTTATRQLYMSGNAVLKASSTLRGNLLDGVSRGTGLATSELSLTDGGVVTPEGVISIGDAVRMCLEQRVPVSAMDTFFAPSAPAPSSNLPETRIFPGMTFGAHGAWVEVDIETGRLQVLDYVACHDVGRAINPTSVEGQIAGAVTQGLGYAMSEQIVLQDGYNLTGAFFQYAIPTSADVSDIRVIVLESGEGPGPFGARGIGEPPIGPCASVIASAVEDAVGARPRQLPILAEQVLACVDRSD